jgi:hypothetical protein
MHHQQNALYISDCVQAFFAVDYAVFMDDYVGIAEDSTRLVKPDAVLDNIRALFALVPFEAHCHLISVLVYTA